MASPNNQLPRRLKVGLVLDSGLDKPDGVQQYILAIGEWLRGQGHEVRYLVGETSRSDIAGVHSLSRNMTVRFNGNRGTIPLPTSKAKLAAFLRAEHFDVLHVQVPYSPFMAQKLVLSSDARTAIIGTFHIAPNDGLVTIGTKALGLWLRSSLKRFDRMLSVSPAAAEFAQQTFKVASDISPNVVDYQRFHAAKILPQYDDEVVTILFLGRLVPRKGCQLLLEAIAKVVKEAAVPKFRVVICGGGALRAKLERYSTANNLQDIVEFVGFVSEEEYPRFYGSADIAVFPSCGGESFGIVLLEAMASGRAAVLAGDNPGYRSVLATRPELLFDPRSAAALGSLLADYLRDAALRSSAAAWGEEFTKDFDVNHVGQQLLEIYFKALRKRREL